MGLDIGQLTGEVSLEDSFSEALNLVAEHAEEALKKIEESFGAVGIAIGAVTTAVGIAAGAITTLGVKGSTLQGVEDAFDTLAEKAGTTGDALRGSLTEGVKGTVDEMKLMQSTMLLMGSGMKLTTDQAEMMGEASRALGKAMGTDAAGGLAVMSSALATGRTRQLQLKIGLIDVKKGEQEFAASIGATVKQLNEAGLLEGKRIAILEATRNYLDRVGDSQLSFKEKIEQAKVSVEEWFSSLEKSVAASPQVNAAFDAISTALQEAFGEGGQSLLETFLGWINKFADVVAVWGPKIIRFFVEVKDAMVAAVNYAVSTYEAIPQWFFMAAESAAKAAVAILATAAAFTALNAVTTVFSFATAAEGAFVSTSKLGDTLVLVGSKWAAFKTLVVGVIAEIVGEATGLEAVMLVLGAAATGPLAVFAASVALLSAGAAGIYQLKLAFDNLDAAFTSGQSMWEFFTAKEDDTFLRRWLGLAARGCRERRRRGQL